MRTVNAIFLSLNRPYESDPPHGRPDILQNLLKHEVEAHGQDGHPQEDVDVAHDEPRPGCQFNRLFSTQKMA